MCRVSTPAVIGGFLLGLLLGCGSPRTPEAVGSGEPIPKPGDPPKPIAKDEVPAQKAGVKIYTKPEDLLADMPKENHPKLANDTGLERDAARKWCQKNLVGRTVEWKDTVESPTVSDREPYTITFRTKAPFHRVPYFGGGTAGRIFGASFTLGDEPCAVFIRSTQQGQPYSDNGNNTGTLSLPGWTADEAKIIRGLKGEVTLRAKVTSADVFVDSYYNNKPLNGISLDIETPTIDEHLPAALRPKNKK